MYVLTDLGKDYSNLLEDDLKTLEKQPKSSVILRAMRKNANGDVEHLLSKRLRHPYFGKVGRLTGKIRFGETIEQAAARELYEETGLTAESYTLEHIYRKMRYREDGACVQDVFFYTVVVTGFSGKFIERTAFQENFWITAETLKNRNDLDIYRDLVLTDDEGCGTFSFYENIDVARGF